MDSLLNSLKTLALESDDTSRKYLIQGLRDLAIELEKPVDSLHRVIHGPFELAFTEVAIHLKLFQYLAESASPLSVEILARKTGASPDALNRILRYLATRGMIKETDEREYRGNHVTKTFSQEGYTDGVHFAFEFYNKLLQITPQFLKDNKYENFSNPIDTPLQKAFGTGVHGFIWIQKEPELLNSFIKLLGCYHKGKGSWTSAVKLRDHCKGSASSDVLFVDVGGSHGTQALEFRKEVPEAQGRVIVQDLQQTIEMSPKSLNLEFMAHDIFTPQIIKDARYYFMRNILNGHLDEHCLSILNNLKSAMAPHSIILIQESVLPDKGATVIETQSDLAMWITQGAQERTEKEWRALLKAAGLRIISITTYSKFEGDSVIEAGLA